MSILLILSFAGFGWLVVEVLSFTGRKVPTGMNILGALSGALLAAYMVQS